MLNDLFRIIGVVSLPELVVVFLTCFIVMYKWMHEHKEKKETARRTKIESLGEALMQDKFGNNAYLIEQLFLDRYGALLNFKEIKFFLRQENPSYLIVQYINSRGFLKLNDNATYLVPKVFLSGIGLNLLAGVANITFSAYGVLGIVSLLLSVGIYFQGSSYSEVVKMVGFSIVFFLYAWLFYIVSYSTESAINLKHITKKSTRHATILPD